MSNSINTDQFETDSVGAERHSIFGEILDWMLAPLLVLWPLSIAITWLVAKSIANQPFDHALEQSLQNLSQQLRLEQGQYRIPAATLRAQSLADELDLRYLQFSDTSQHILDGDIALPTPSKEEAKPGIQFRNSNLYGQELRIAYMWLAIPSPPAANSNTAAAPHFALLQVAETLHKRAKLANEIIRGVILPQFVILPLALFLVWFALARGLSPIAVLQQRIRARQPDDVSPILSLNLPQEIAPLLQSLNEMLARLAHAIAQQKRFIADAAHQMKTPLAGMRMQTELALRDAGQANLAEVHRSLLQLAKSSENATHLVNQLLSLARAENQPATDGWQSVDLLALAQQTLQDWVALAMSKSIDLGFEVRSSDAQPTPSAAWLYGQPFLLRELMNNLIDNALRYNTPGCVVTLRLTISTEVIELEVEDNGPGIAPSERERVFERFYRILGNQASGSGLGLAIVREIALQHLASISISEHPACHNLANRGCVFHICFPAGLAQDAPSASITGTLAIDRSIT